MWADNSRQKFARHIPGGPGRSFGLPPVNPDRDRSDPAQVAELIPTVPRRLLLLPVCVVYTAILGTWCGTAYSSLRAGRGALACRAFAPLRVGRRRGRIRRCSDMPMLNGLFRENPPASVSPKRRDLGIVAVQGLGTALNTTFTQRIDGGSRRHEEFVPADPASASDQGRRGCDRRPQAGPPHRSRTRPGTLSSPEPGGGWKVRQHGSFIVLAALVAELIASYPEVAPRPTQTGPTSVAPGTILLSSKVASTLLRSRSESPGAIQERSGPPSPQDDTWRQLIAYPPHHKLIPPRHIAVPQPPKD